MSNIEEVDTTPCIRSPFRIVVSSSPWTRAAVLLVLLALCAPAYSDALDSLNRFYENVQTYTADFEQVVLDEGLNPIEESSGTVLISRPGRFRWDYDPPNEQIVASDGKKVWLYDIELEQVTVRLQEQSLGKTPASLLAGTGDIESGFDVRDIGPSGVLEWVGITPRDSDSGFQDMRIGFEGNQLRTIELVDGLGQTTRMTMRNGLENEAIDDSQFVLAAPPGVDVIDETLE